MLSQDTYKIIEKNNDIKSLIGFNQCRENLRLTLTTTELMTIIFPTE